MPILTPEEAVAKREQLVRDGFCVVPGVLGGALLDAVHAYCDSILDAIPVNQSLQYQGSDFHINTARRHHNGDLIHPDKALWTPLADELIDLQAAVEACDLLGLEGRRPDDTILILNKPAHGPALYWHQDFMNWNHPSAATPWPTRIFLSYYMVDTSIENGCLKAIPGTHLRRIPLHDHLPAAHGPEIQALDTDHIAFHPHPDEVAMPVKAGDLVINDARLLHAAHPNQTDQRRTLVLQWHSVFPWPSVPTWWDRPLPAVLEQVHASLEVEGTRIPGPYWAIT